MNIHQHYQHLIQPRSAIARFVVRVEPELRGNLAAIKRRAAFKEKGLTTRGTIPKQNLLEKRKFNSQQRRDEFKAAGLTSRGTIPKNTKRPELAGLSPRDYKREIVRLWRKKQKQQQEK